MSNIQINQSIASMSMLSLNDINEEKFLNVDKETYISHMKKYLNIYMVCLKDDIEMNVDKINNLRGLLKMLRERKDDDTIINTCKNLTLTSNVEMMNNDTVYKMRDKIYIMTITDVKKYFDIELSNISDDDKHVMLIFSVQLKKNYLNDILQQNTKKTMKNYVPLEREYIKSCIFKIIDDICIMNEEITDDIKKTIIDLCKKINVDTSNRKCKLTLNDIFEKRTQKFLKYGTYYTNGYDMNDMNDMNGYDMNDMNGYVIVNDSYGMSANINDANANHYNFHIKKMFKKHGNILLDESSNRYLKSKNAKLTRNINIELCRLMKMIKNDERIYFSLFNELLSSHLTCDWILNNREMLKISSDLFNKYRPLYSYLLGYSWTSLYSEENAKGIDTIKTDRYVFDITTANLLPTFPFSKENIHKNPYMTLLLADHKMNATNNYMSIPPMYDYNDYYGVCSKRIAQMRLNVFTSGDCNTNIFSNIDKNTYAITGSCMTACLQKFNPLMYTCYDNVNEYKPSYDKEIDNLEDISEMSLLQYDRFNKSYNKYFDKYYGMSDIDVICCSTSHNDYLNDVNILIDKVCANVGCDRKYIDINATKNTAIIISHIFSDECVDDVNEKLQREFSRMELKTFIYSMVKMGKNALLDNKTIEYELYTYFYNIYLEEKKKRNDKWKKMMRKEYINDVSKIYNKITEKENIIFKISNANYSINNQKNNCDNETNYFASDFRNNNKPRGNSDSRVLKISESIKFKISSLSMMRPIEIFKSDHTSYEYEYDPFKIISRFHLPCVRACYHNDDFYMLPSFITSMMTFINIDYKYIHGSTKPNKIINKNRKRGYGSILNNLEKNTMKIYSVSDNENDEWIGYRNDVDIKMNTINNKRELLRLYKETMGYDESESITKFLDYNAIGVDGIITPYQNWLSNSMYEYINK